MKLITSFFALLLITGCVTTAEELSATSDHKATISTNQNYQSVYRNVLTEAKNCYAGMQNLAVSNVVEGQLYSDLKFGEISYFQENLSRIYYAVVKVEKVGSGSKASISVGSQMSWAAEKTLRNFENWVRGEKGC
jgi:hypothetical protein